MTDPYKNTLHRMIAAHYGLVDLLTRKGVITESEYETAVAIATTKGDQFAKTAEEKYAKKPSE